MIVPNNIVQYQIISNHISITSYCTVSYQIKSYHTIHSSIKSYNIIQYDISHISHKISCKHIQYIIAREGGPPAKDPAPSHPAYTTLHTSIYIKQSRSNTYKNTHKHTQKHIHKTKQTPLPKQHPKKQNSKKYITLYNSKYCIRVVLRSKIDDIVCS